MHFLPHAKPPRRYGRHVQKFRRRHPNKSAVAESHRWRRFRKNLRWLYRQAAYSLLDNQMGLCAYCEIRISPRKNWQIEHFLPKSLSTRGHDLTTDFSNFLLCCQGGTNSLLTDRSNFDPNPSVMANTSCGQVKDDTDPRGLILNPYELPELPLFKESLRPHGLFLIPDEESCQKEGIAKELVESTIRNLGLNCPRLARSRKEVWDEILKELDDLYEKGGDFKELSELAKDHLTPYLAKYKKREKERLLPFFTTRVLAFLPEFNNNFEELKMACAY